MYGDDYEPLAEFVFTHDQPSAKEKSQKPVTVRVTGPWQVQHDGKRYTEGQQATVPEHLAETWEQSKWVERVAKKAAPKKPKPPDTTSKEETDGTP